MTLNFGRIQHILFVIPSRRFGGAEKHSLDMCDEFARSGAEVTILSTRQCLASPAFLRCCYKTVAKNIAWDESRSAIDNALVQEVKVEEVLMEARAEGCAFDFVFVCASWPHYACGVHSRLVKRNVPHIVISHLFPHNRLEERYVWPEQIGTLYTAASALRYAWVGVSWLISRRVERSLNLPANSVTTIENGIDVVALTTTQRRLERQAARARLGVAGDKRVILVLGRLDRAKGADLVPTIVDRIADLDPLVVCAGEGELAERIQTSPAVQLGLIRLLGYVAEPSDWIFAADVLLLPSRVEGHPLVFLEAAARRCPVVSTDVALECYGTRASELALIAAMDDVGRLANTLREALVSPDRLEARVEAAYQLARARSRSAMMVSYKRLVRQVHAACAHEEV